MKEYQARTADHESIACSFNSEQQGRKWFSELSDTDWRRKYVLVLSEWETDAEADAARLDWLEHNSYSWDPGYHNPGVRRNIDRLRNAPKPKVTRVEV